MPVYGTWEFYLNQGIIGGKIIKPYDQGLVITSYSIHYTKLYEIDVFDEWIGGAHNFHLFFLFQLSRFLGFYPGELKDVHFFDLLNGRFSELQPLHGSFLEGKSLALWKALYGLNITSLEVV